MSQAGWYPDPGGQPGMFRYWDGQVWSSTVTPNPYAPTPQPQQAQPGLSPLAVRPDAQPYPYAAAERPRRPWGAWAIIGVVVLALLLGGGALLNSGLFNPGGGGQVPSNPTDFCPKRSTPTASPTVRPQPPGRVQGGALSYPRLGEPWGAPQGEDRVPFGRDVAEQHVMLHPNYDRLGSDWVASVLVGELVAGDGFFSPQQGSEIVTRCIMGEFYGDAVLTRQDVVNEAATVDGVDAWLVEMHLGFSIAGLDETGETAIVLVVATGTESSSIFYASIPDSRPDLLVAARQVQGQLRVER